MPRGMVADRAGIEGAGFDGERQRRRLPYGFKAYGAHVAHLFAYKRAVGEDVGGRRAERVDAEGHAELAGLEAQLFRGPDACPRVEHLYLAAVAEIGLHVVVGPGGYLSAYVEAGVAHLKARFAVLGRVFKPCPCHAVNLREIVDFFGRIGFGGV